MSAEEAQLKLRISELKQAIKANNLLEQEFFEACGVPLCPTHDKRCPAHSYHWIIEELKQLRSKTSIKAFTGCKTQITPRLTFSSKGDVRSI